MEKVWMLNQLREVAGQVEEGEPIHIPENACRIEKGRYTAEEMARLLYFIADMLE